MKYIKTFEKLIKLDLDDYDQISLMTQYINEYDNIFNNKNRNNIHPVNSSDNKKNILLKIKNLFKNGFDPNINFIGSDTPFVYILDRQSKYYIELLELFVYFGLNGRIANDIIANDTIHWSMSDVSMLKKLKILLNSDVNLLEKLKSTITRYNNMSIFDAIDEKIITDKISKKVADKIFNIISNKKPEQYKIYLMKKDGKKFNL